MEDKAPVQPNERLFVGNLPFSMNDQALRDLFAKVEGCEVKEAVIIMSKNSQFGPRSMGYGFVTMGDTEQAKAAMAALNGSEIEGRKIAVDFARPRAERTDR